MSDHSIISISSSGIWANPQGCTGYPSMAIMYPETERSEDALEGDAAHELGERLIDRYRRGLGDHGESPVGTAASNGVIIDDDMLEGATMYAKECHRVMREFNTFGGDNMGVERRMGAPETVHPLFWGTPDFWAYSPKGAVIKIVDFKYGRRFVDVFENWQLVGYLLTIMEHLQIDGFAALWLRVELTIVQPRAYGRDGPIRTWTFQAADIRGMANNFRMNAEKSLGPDAEFRSGPHCRDCPGRHACPSAIQASIGLYEVASAPIPYEMTPEQLGAQLTLIRRAREALKAVETGTEAQVEALVRRGEFVGPWGLETTQGRQKWSRPVEEVKALGALFEVPLVKETYALTPKQAIKAGLDEDTVNAYSNTPNNGQKLVADAGKRSSILFKTTEITSYE